VRENLCPALPRDGEPPPATPAAWGPRRVILFTEYVDTADQVVRCLRAAFAETDRGEERVARFHGALDDEKRAALQRAFNAPPDEEPLRVLVCTDAAREGVNLQARCADLFHLDIPWNPSRMEQRNGRIDRKLQPAPVVRCHYFTYRQRAEDHVLEVLVRRTKTAHAELGGIPEVLERSVLGLLEGGIAHAEAPRVAAAVTQLALGFEEEVKREEGDDAGDGGDDAGDAVGEASVASVVAETGAVRVRREKLAEQLAGLDRVLEESRRHLGIDEHRLRFAVSSALELLGLPALAPTAPPRHVDASSICWALPPRERFLAIDRSWDDTLDAVRPARPKEQSWAEWRRTAPLRPVVFRDAGSVTEEVVHLHLDHPVVRRLLGRFLAQGFAHDEMSRVCVLTSDESVRRVVLLGRVALYGHGAARLHDEVVEVAAQWTGEHGTRKEPLKPYAQRTTREARDVLDVALVSGDAGAANAREVELFRGSVAADVAELLPALQARALAAIEAARTLLQRRGESEARAMREILEAQRARIAATLGRYENPNPEQRRLFDLLTVEERRQVESDREHWRRRLREIERELVDEPARIVRGYEVRVDRVEPLGVVYLTRGER
jgi:hypothetical protein